MLGTDFRLWLEFASLFYFKQEIPLWVSYQFEYVSPTEIYFDMLIKL